MSNPCHIELILSEKEESVKKEVIALAHRNIRIYCLNKIDSHFVCGF